LKKNPFSFASKSCKLGRTSSGAASSGRKSLHSTQRVKTAMSGHADHLSEPVSHLPDDDLQLQPRVEPRPGPGNTDSLSGCYQDKTVAGRMCGTIWQQSLLSLLLVAGLAAIIVTPAVILSRDGDSNREDPPTSTSTPTTSTAFPEGHHYLYLDDTTILNMTTLQPISCDQQFPGQLDYHNGWSQGAVVPVQGEDRLVICGGDRITGCLVWTPTGWQSMNTPYFNKRSVAAGSLVEGGWLVTGGYDGSYLLSSVVLYRDDEWHDYASMPASVVRHCQVTVDSDVYVIGGYNNGAVSTVYKLSDGAWYEFSSLKTHRYGHMCSVLGGTIYVMGGYDGDNDGYDDHNYLNSVELLHPGSDEWVPGPTLPGAVYRGQSVIHDNTLYVLGGRSYSDVDNTAIYRLDGDHWVTEEASLDSPRRIVFPAPLLSSRDLNCVE